MSLISQVIDQLEAELSETFQTIGEAWTVDPVAELNASLPAAWAHLFGIDSEASPYDNRTIQPAEMSFAVLIVCATADLETRVQDVSGALTGFQFDSDGTHQYDPAEHRSGQVIGINQSVVWWRDLWAVRRYPV